jgi:hypothetical protein
MQPTRAEVTTRAGGWVEADRLRGAIKSAGFKPGEIRYTVSGTLTEWHSQPALRLSGSEQLLVLQPEPKAADAYEQVQQVSARADTQAMQVEGLLIDHAVPGDKTAPPALRVTRIAAKS